MENETTSLFEIDPLLSSHSKKTIEAVISGYKHLHVTESQKPQSGDEFFIVSFYSSTTLLDSETKEKFRVLVIPNQSENSSEGSHINNVILDTTFDAILEEKLEVFQIKMIISSFYGNYLEKKKKKLFSLGFKNVKNFEKITKSILRRGEDLIFNSDFLLAYAQSLVELQRNLFHCEELFQIEKVIKVFLKNNLERFPFRFVNLKNSRQITIKKNFLPIPEYKRDWIGIEMEWHDSNPINTIKALFFYQVLVDFFINKKEDIDPFGDQDFWQTALDAIPFPLALLSCDAEVHQHNVSFAKLGISAPDCLKLSLKDKIQINNISYNIFRKEIIQSQRSKILFVFFTESFFLRGDSKLSPSGQELGIISSSIAHELNNPIAGIQAAIEVLLMESELNGEEQKILFEMKNGALRCKQLIEIFLGFSKANPGEYMSSANDLSTVEVCFQQALNLLRFRTIESGIRFNLERITSADFCQKINPSLLTMTFYLIFGELMTLYSHKLLVANKNQTEKVIMGEIFESAQEIHIQLKDLNIAGLPLSKLIQNLLNIESFTLQISDFSLRFIHSPRTSGSSFPHLF